MLVSVSSLTSIVFNELFAFEFTSYDTLGFCFTSILSGVGENSTPVASPVPVNLQPF